MVFTNDGHKHYDIRVRCQYWPGSKNIFGAFMQWYFLLRICFVLFLFFVDCAALYWFNAFVLHALAAYYFALLIRKERTAEQIICVILLGVESFLVHGRFGAYLLPILPLTLLYKLLARFITMTRLVPYTLLGVTLLVNSFIIDPFLFGQYPPLGYTIIQIIGNLSLLIPFTYGAKTPHAKKL
jgi:hypothetical protein